jgi:hypothetical protein
MIEGIHEHFQQLATAIMHSISDPWSRATSEAIFFSEHIEFVNEFTRETDKKSVSFALNKDGRNAFMDIRELFKTANKPLWCRAKFIITSDGKFDMKWSYENCGESGFAKFDADIELQRKREIWKA